MSGPRCSRRHWATERRCAERLPTTVSDADTANPEPTLVPPRVEQRVEAEHARRENRRLGEPERERDGRDPPNGVAQGDVEQRRQSDDPDAGEQLEQDDRAEPRRVRACGEHIAHTARRHRGREEPSGKARDELRDEGGTDVPRDRSLRRGGHDAHLPQRLSAPQCPPPWATLARLVRPAVGGVAGERHWQPRRPRQPVQRAAHRRDAVTPPARRRTRRAGTWCESGLGRPPSGTRRRTTLAVRTPRSVDVAPVPGGIDHEHRDTPTAESSAAVVRAHGMARSSSALPTQRRPLPVDHVRTSAAGAHCASRRSGGSPGRSAA